MKLDFEWVLIIFITLISFPKLFLILLGLILGPIFI